jgi:hypothetical protein
MGYRKNNAMRMMIGMGTPRKKRRMERMELPHGFVGEIW